MDSITTWCSTWIASSTATKVLAFLEGPWGQVRYRSRLQGCEDLNWDNTFAPTNQAHGPSPHNYPGFSDANPWADSCRRYLGALCHIWEILNTRWVALSRVRRHASPQLTLSDQDPNKHGINWSAIQTKKRSRDRYEWGRVCLFHMHFKITENEQYSLNDLCMFG